MFSSPPVRFSVFFFFIFVISFLPKRETYRENNFLSPKTNSAHRGIELPYNSSLGITSNKYSFRIKEQNFKQENLINVSICKIYTAQRWSDLYPRNQHPLLWQGKNSCIASYIHSPSLHQTTLLLHLNIFISNWIENDYNNFYRQPPQTEGKFLYI